MSARRFSRVGTMVLSALMAGIGVALVVEVVAGEGGLLSGRMVLGVCFLVAGAGRLYVELLRGRASR